ncbi:aspartate kinase [Aureitalea marina]|uniref:Aspartokinase n=1 Tax=Aureitalea marina TaxID=930804 RepID=A0A2S7KRM0_9FLAO|nr:aspartate kinase [Aureitalea marina]PQB05271.1 aspartate kinase [Aureitalea marina]
MNVYKFGGASVKDADGVRNLARVLDTNPHKDLVIVVSAMGKMTNALEKVVDHYFNDKESLEASMATIYDYHKVILDDLFEIPSHEIYGLLQQRIEELRAFFLTNKSSNHAFVYDQIVCFGELISTAIISAYLSENGVKNTWLDVRGCLHTDDYYRSARVDWELTQKSIQADVSSKGITITQGFLGSERQNNFTTTLGREGSDYTAAIFAYCLNAHSVTIWKDVPGVLNADPRYFSNTRLLNHISYREAIELAFYGASVIHPKTLQPLQRKEIPLYVKSFVDPSGDGTCVGKGVTLDPMTSCFILKKDQVLISLSSLDFSFMMEDNFSEVFNLLHRYKMKVEMIQNSAISFSVCIDNKYNKLEPLLNKLREKFKVTCYFGVTLYTVRHSTPVEIQSLTREKEVLLKQETAETVQLVVNE